MPLMNTMKQLGLNSIPTKDGRGESEGVDFTYRLSGKKDSATYELTFLNFLAFLHNKVVATEDFVIGNYKWSLLLTRIMFPDFSRECLYVAVRSHNDSNLSLDCRMTMKHPHDDDRHVSYRNLEMVGKQDMIEKTFDFDTAKRFMRLSDSRRILEFEIKIKAIDVISMVPRTIGDDMRWIHLEGLSDEIIGRHVDVNECFGVARPRRKRCGVLQRNFRVDAFCSSSVSKRFWLCSKTADGRLSVDRCLNLVPSGVTFGDLIVEEQSWVVVFAEGNDRIDHFPTLMDDSMLIFCKLYDPNIPALRYVGHFFVQRSNRCLRLFEKAFDLADLPEDSEFSIYLETNDDDIVQEVQRFASLNNNGIKSGSVIIVRAQPNEPLPEDVVREELVPFRFSEWGDIQFHDPVADLPVSDDEKLSQDEENCVICTVNPSSAGFVHKGSCHRCVCDTCVNKIYKGPNSLCPICREPIEHVIRQFF